ncbi:hypothetical protein ACV229_37750 [Burkholderia sp. MR1-5-21]
MKAFAPMRGGRVAAALAIACAVAVASTGTAVAEGGAPGAAAAPAEPAGRNMATDPVPPRDEPIPIARLDASLLVGERLRQFTITDQPGLFVLYTPGLAEQGAMFSRIVALFERRDMPRDRIVSMTAIERHAHRFDTDPADLTAGNNFSTTELAHFFDIARRQRLTLTEGERTLQALLTGWGLIRDEDGARRPRSAREFLITIPGPGPAPDGTTIDATARAAILNHELGHWRYFSDPAYAHACRTFWWHDLTFAERAELTRQLANVGYDPRDRIVIDETQAYLLHTPAEYIPFTDTTAIDVAGVRRRLQERVGHAAW